MFIIIKPTDLCNMRCRYCFIADNAPTTKMTSEQALSVLFGVYEYAQKSAGLEEITICWHGGEPLVMGHTFYRSVFYGFPHWYELGVGHTMQTNMVLLDEEYCRLFAEYGLSLSTSLDGPETIHNRSRRFRDGQGTYASVVSGIELARKYDIRVGLISVLSQANIHYIDQLYAFYKSLGLMYKANHLLKVGRKSYDDIAIDYHQYADALLRFFELFIADPDPGFPEIQSFRIARSLLTGTNPACPFTSNCQDGIICINSDGRVFPCESFPYIEGAHNYCYGNVFETSIIDIMEGQVREFVRTRRGETIERCRHCEFSRICNGGCLIDGLLRQEGPFAESIYCDDIQRMFASFRKLLEETGLRDRFEQLAIEKGMTPITLAGF